MIKQKDQSLQKIKQFYKIKLIQLRLKQNKLNNLTKSCMNSLQNAQHVINLIVKQSKDKIQQNKIVRTMAIPYSNAIIQNKKNDIMLHAGINYDKQNSAFFKNQIDSQSKPNNSLKDTYTFFSVKKYKQDKKQNSQISVPKQLNSKKALNNFFKASHNIHHTNQGLNKIKENDRKLNASKQEQKQSSFIKLEQKKEYIPRFIEKQDKNVQDLRQIKNHQIFQKQTQRKREESQSEISTQRQNKLTSYLQNHLARQNNYHTYDIEGNILLFSAENNKKAITKAYPPTIRYQVQNEENQNQEKLFKNKSKGYKNRINSNLVLKQKQKFNHHLNGAKGQIFKSSVLKTINLSRISLGNEHFDEVQFMKRNDLFNNNHSRQTTSIPFIRVEGGSLFKQTATNQFVSNKQLDTEASSRNGNEKSRDRMSQQRAKSQGSRYRNQFRKFSLKKQSQTCSNSFFQNHNENKLYPGTTKNQRKINSIGDSRYSSFYIQRPHTTQVGRIKRQNQILFHSMLQQN